MQLTLTPEIETALTEKASQRRISPQQLALEGLRKLFVPVVEETREQSVTLADFLSGYIGVIRSSEVVEGGAQLSQSTGNRFAQLMVQKRRKGRL